MALARCEQKQNSMTAGGTRYHNMGMYDYVVCQHPFPDGTIHTEELQTKDFDCMMTTLTITADGRLLIEDSHYETVPEQERPYYGTSKWDENILYRLSGSIRRVVDAVRDTNYHGDFYFGSMTTEYVARFSNGQLDWIREVPYN